MTIIDKAFTQKKNDVETGNVDAELALGMTYYNEEVLCHFSASLHPLKE